MRADRGTADVPGLAPGGAGRRLAPARGLPAVTGSSEDAALLLVDAHEPALIVGVGWHPTPGRVRRPGRADMAERLPDPAAPRRPARRRPRGRRAAPPAGAHLAAVAAAARAARPAWSPPWCCAGRHDRSASGATSLVDASQDRSAPAAARDRRPPLCCSPRAPPCWRCARRRPRRRPGGRALGRRAGLPRATGWRARPAGSRAGRRARGTRRPHRRPGGGRAGRAAGHRRRLDGRSVLVVAHPGRARRAGRAVDPGRAARRRRDLTGDADPDRDLRRPGQGAVAAGGPEPAAGAARTSSSPTARCRSSGSGTVLARADGPAAEGDDEATDETDQDAAEVIAGLDELGAVHLDGDPGPAGRAGRGGHRAGRRRRAGRTCRSSGCSAPWTRRGRGAVLDRPRRRLGRDPVGVRQAERSDLDGVVTVDSAGTTGRRRSPWCSRWPSRWPAARAPTAPGAARRRAARVRAARRRRGLITSKPVDRRSSPSDTHSSPREPPLAAPRDHQAHLRHRGRRLLARQGPDRLRPRAACCGPAACGSRCRSSTPTSTSTPGR